MLRKFIQLSAMAAAAQASNTMNKTHAQDEEASNNWAVIVAGSRGYMNYRHHADVCHAYHIAIANGIPEEQIIVMAYDDVAQDSMNPYKGKLFNKPTADGVPGVDVYEGCKIDYKGEKVNKMSLIGVLIGDTTFGEKVLKSNHESKVFFYYADHGAPGLVGMPSGQSLKANELHNTIQMMHDSKMYKQMVIYMEACESGSMFEKILESNLDVYAVSAANSHESSWGTYCMPDDKVDGKHIGSCLGDLFSVNWMEDTDRALKEKEMGTETLQTQYETVMRKTTKSHVLQWGDLKITSEVIGEFEAGHVTKQKDFWSAFKSVGKDLIKNQVGWEDAATARKNDFAIDVRDIKLHYLYSNVLQNPSVETQKALMDELDHRLKVDKIFAETFPTFIESVKKRDYPLPKDDSEFECYQNLIDTYTETCGDADTYTQKYFGAFLHQCQAIKYYPAALADYKGKLSMACKRTE